MLPHVDDAERRRRIAVRHRLGRGEQDPGVETACGRMVGLHATDPSTIYLSAWARTTGFDRADLDRALYADRSLVKHMAMRRTLWLVARDDLPVVQAAASARVADSEGRRLVRDVEKAGLHSDGAGWLAEVGDQVVAAVADGREATSSQLRDELPLLAGAVVYSPGRSWGGPVPLAPRVLTWLSASGRVVRATNRGGWTTSRPTWATMADWLGAPIDALGPAEASTELVRRWLRTFGPGTDKDIQWWLGSTKRDVRAALHAVEAVEVGLDAGGTGWVLPDDLAPTPTPDPWVALLPGLDPTTMGWSERGWHLGPHAQHLFDRNGNAGPTVWCDGRVVGGWRQDDDGRVQVQLLESIGPDRDRLVEREAARLTEHLGGTRILPRFPSPLFRAS